MKRIFALLFLLLLQIVSAYAGEIHDKLFDKLDKNADGKLSKQEFVDGKHHEVNRTKVIQFFPAFKDMSGVQEKEYRSRLFDAMDVNKDGLLDKDEWGKAAPNILEIRF